MITKLASILSLDGSLSCPFNLEIREIDDYLLIPGCVSIPVYQKEIKCFELGLPGTSKLLVEHQISFKYSIHPLINKAKDNSNSKDSIDSRKYPQPPNQHGSLREKALTSDGA